MSTLIRYLKRWKSFKEWRWSDKSKSCTKVPWSPRGEAPLQNDIIGFQSGQIKNSLWEKLMQSHYREVVRWEIPMKNIWDLGWFWAGWQYWKTNWAKYEQLLRVFFSCFEGQNIFLNIVVSALKSCIKWRQEKWKKSLKK